MKCDLTVWKTLFVLVVGCSLVSHADTVQVSTADELIALFQNTLETTVSSDIELLNDLDFSTSNLPFPLGVNSNGTCVAYSGVFHGNYHSIKGLVMDNTNNKVW